MEGGDCEGGTGTHFAHSQEGDNRYNLQQFLSLLHPELGMYQHQNQCEGILDMHRLRKAHTVVPI